jgi:predicted carbohydrate-binding protein with CBM5 and CBM33 domain
MSNAESENEFFKIIDFSFTEGDINQMLLNQEPQTTNRELIAKTEDDDNQRRIDEASNDKTIGDYLLHAIGTELQLIAYLQASYDLTESQAVDAMQQGIHKIYEVIDLGEA